MTLIFRIFLALLLFVEVACSTYASRIRGPRRNFEEGKFQEAIVELKELVEKKDNDYLLYLLELGTVYHNAGQYKDAIDVFRKAEKAAEIKDYTSLTEESMAVLLNDSIKDYKGEHFERVLINVYLAMDYTLLGDFEGALVECRRVNHILDRMIKEGKLPYEHNAFAKYLAATLFEAQREYNDAFVDYRELLKWADDFPYLATPLLRTADRLKASQEYESYRKKYPSVKDYKLTREEGEVVLLVEQGLVPYKVPNPEFRLLPKFTQSTYNSHSVVIRDKSGKYRAESAPAFDIEKTAIHELSERTAGIIAKKVGGIVLKQAAAYGVEQATNSKELGLLTSLVLHLSDQADLRSWSTLPARLQIARFVLPAGKHDLFVDLVSQGGSKTPSVKSWQGLDIKGGKIHFLHYRISGPGGF